MTTEYIFVEVDMRKDFSNDPRSSLGVPGALEIVGKMAVIEDNSRVILEIMDSHEFDDPVSQEEFDTYGEHCVPGTWGHNRIEGLPDFEDGDLHLKKNTYDAWVGMTTEMECQNPSVLKVLRTFDAIVVGGVVTGICIKAFIDGIISRDLAKKTIVISDCVANLDMDGIPTTEECFKEWKEAGVRVMSYKSFITEFVM